MTWVAVVVGGSALVGAGASVYNAKQNSKNANRLTGQQQPLIDAQTGLVKALTPYATGFYSRAQQAWDPAFNYFHSLMSGNRGDLVSALAPEIGGINDRYNTLAKTSAELMPRGGASASFLGSLPYRRADEIQSLISGGRANAAGALSSLASEAGSLGAGAAGATVNGATGATNGLMSIYGVQQNANAQNAAAYQQLAQALASLGKYDANSKTWSWAWQ